MIRNWFMLALCSLPLAGATAERYTNGAGFDLALDVPADARMCTDPPPAPDHGVRIVYDSRSCSESTNRNAPGIRLAVWYNSADATDDGPPASARQLADMMCRAAGVTPSAETLGGLPLYECVERKGDDAVEVKFIAQKTSASNAFESRNYAVSIACARADLALYRHRLHELLKSVRTDTAGTH